MRFFDGYEEARAWAQAQANTSGRGFGLERVNSPLEKGFRVFGLPGAKFRSGHELRCEAVDPENVSRGKMEVV